MLYSFLTLPNPTGGIFVILHAMETFDGMLYVHVYLSLWVLGQALNLSPTSFESRSQLTLKMQDTVKSHEINILSRQGETFYTYNHYIAPECAIWKKQKSAQRIYHDRSSCMN